MSELPSISVVMGVYNGTGYLPETIESVLCQTEANFEFIIVNDGSTEDEVAHILSSYETRDQRIRTITKPNEGLTKALIDGCAAAKGEFIARIDLGDVMMPERLARQKAVLDAHHEVVLATCWTECCGPEWEHLYTKTGKVTLQALAEYWVTGVIPDHGGDDLLEGPTSHPSVMMRTDSYRKAGGYRPEFYYGQDWDLWYRLADLGKFAGVQEALYRCRIFPDGISMRNAERQRQIHECSRCAFLARCKGEDETSFLEKAMSIRPGKDAGNGHLTASSRRQLAAGYYFVGEALRRNGDGRCRKYFMQALCKHPNGLRSWVRLAQAVFM